MPTKLPKRVADAIRARISGLFDKVKTRLFGRPYGENIEAHVRHDKQLTLPGIHAEALKDSGGLPDTEVLDSLVDTTTNYIDSLKLRAQNKAIKEVEQQLSKDPNINSIKETLDGVWKDVTNQLGTIIDSETQAAKNIGLLQGIIRTNSALRIERPIVYFVVVLDEYTCENCIKLHLMEDKNTPRLWYLDELSHGYWRKGDEVPSVLGTHPHCRCQMITLLPGYGFRNGAISYISKDFDAIADQRS